jgi:hypothetical protein
MCNYSWDGKTMTQYFKGTLLAVVSIAVAGFAMAENPPATSDQQATDQTSPSTASSPHQRNTTKEEATEATSTADTDPSASSTKHQQQTTGVRTAKSKAEKDQMMKDCVEQAQTLDSSMSMERAKKSCEDQMKSSERTGGG